MTSGPGLEVAGSQGGMVTAVFIGAWVAASAFWIGIGATIFRIFIQPQIKALRADLAAEKAACAREMDALKARIGQLETITLMDSGARLREFGAWELPPHGDDHDPK